MFDWKRIIIPYFQLHSLDWWFWVSWKRRNRNTGTKVPKAKLWSTSIIGWFRPTQRIWCWKGWKSVPYWSGQANSFSTRSVSGSKIGRISWIWTSQRSTGKVIIDKSRVGRFLWNSNWYLGWIWADWQYWKKRSGPIMNNFWGWFFHVFRGKKKC